MVKENGEQMESERWTVSAWRAYGIWMENRIWWVLSEQRIGSTNKAQSQTQCEQRVIAEHKMKNLLEDIGRFYWLLIFNV